MRKTDKVPKSAEVVVRSGETNQVVMLSAVPASLTSDTIEAYGMVGLEGLKHGTAAAVHIKRKELDKLRIKERDAEGRPGITEIYFVDSNGREAAQRFYLKVMRDASGRFEVAAGQYHGDSGRVLDVALYTDVEPTTVIIAVAAVCLALIALDAALTDCYEEHAAAVEECRELGGVPVATMHSTFFVTFSPEIRLGCDVWCEFDCRPGPTKEVASLPARPTRARPVVVTTTTTRLSSRGTPVVVTQTEVQAEKEGASGDCTVEVFLTGFRVSTHEPDIGDDWRIKIWVDNELVFVKHIQLGPGRTWNPEGGSQSIATRRHAGKCGQKVPVKLMVTTWEIDVPPVDPHDEGSESATINRSCTHGHTERVTLQTVVFEDNDRGTDSVHTQTYLQLKYACSESGSETGTA